MDEPVIRDWYWIFDADNNSDIWDYKKAIVIF